MGYLSRKVNGRDPDGEKWPVAVLLGIPLGGSYESSALFRTTWNIFKQQWYRGDPMGRMEHRQVIG